jgi:hypothetical protein
LNANRAQFARPGTIVEAHDAIGLAFESGLVAYRKKAMRGMLHQVYVNTLVK